MQNKDKVPMADYEKIMDALNICAYQPDDKTGKVGKCQNCYFNEHGCIVALMMSTREIMRRLKPAVEKMQGGDGDDDTKM